VRTTWSSGRAARAASGQLVGEENVNGVAAARYKANPQILNVLIATWGVTAANDKVDGLTQAGDIWIAKDGGFGLD
jgi:hypothetical protein